MSGPKTVIVATPDPCTALLSAAAIMAAAAVAAGYSRAAELREESREDAEAHRRAQAEASRSGQEALQRDLQGCEARFQRLMQLAIPLGLEKTLADLRPQRPGDQDWRTQAAYVKGLQALLDEAESILLTEAARRQADCATSEEMVLPEGLLSRPLSRSERLLQRVVHLGAPPQDIAQLAAELDATPPGERAALLARELRTRVQHWVEETQARRLQEAQAIIFEQTLKDLGYAVEGLEHTLFVEGGVVHFQKPGWGDYMVRMRVGGAGKGESAANFNVVRAVDTTANEASVLDHIAEDRWCAEFPALLNALAARGLYLTVTRHLQAGELPVQKVERSKLPQFAGDEEAQTAKRLLERSLK